MHLFVQAHELNPLNKAIANQITICKHEMKNQEVKDKELYKSMLELRKANKNKKVT